jgi:hypothetical protein
LDPTFGSFYLIRTGFTLDEPVSIALDPTFGSFYFIRTGFKLDEPVSLVKVFRLFKLEHMFFDFESVDTVGRCTTSYLLAGSACL